MAKEKPLLKIYADQKASHRSLIGMTRSARIYGFLAFGFGVVLAYLIVNEIAGFTALFSFLCLLSAGMSWLSYHSISGYREEYQKLPLLYSFYTDGFISHRGEQKYSWEHIAKLHYSGKNILFEMSRNPHKTAKLTTLNISPASISLILRHLKTHAPDKLTRKIVL